ncbi:MAG TPA: redox-sensing transcriptional repressor Rex [Firmicutes bacterium]|jgi:redox-sensing transcriptional repressor|nr:redox-sensing transcriptional repressor Rex [Bacillota bacterium]
MRWKKISDAVVRRLPLYLRVLNELIQDAPEKRSISSQELGDRAGFSPALVRKDLAWFGEFGKQGVGYEVAYLQQELRHILNLDQDIGVGLVGVGQLGRALTRYHHERMVQEKDFRLNLRALFDNDPSKVGQEFDGLPIMPLAALPEQVERQRLEMMIITVPASQAQEVTDVVTSCGIKAILNFAPTKLNVPLDVNLSNADVMLELQRLAYYLQN